MWLTLCALTDALRSILSESTQALAHGRVGPTPNNPNSPMTGLHLRQPEPPKNPTPYRQHFASTQCASHNGDQARKRKAPPTPEACALSGGAALKALHVSEAMLHNQMKSPPPSQPKRSRLTPKSCMPTHNALCVPASGRGAQSTYVLTIRQLSRERAHTLIPPRTCTARLTPPARCGAKRRQRRSNPAKSRGAAAPPWRRCGATAQTAACARASRGRWGHP